MLSLLRRTSTGSLNCQRKQHLGEFMTSFPTESSGDKKMSIRYKLVIIEALVVAVPLLTFAYVIYAGHYQLEFFHLVLITVILLLILSGLMILRQIFNSISAVASTMKTKAEEISIPETAKDISELHDISASFHNLIQKLERTTQNLNKKVFELLAIRELMEVIQKSLHLDDLLGFLLEKSMAVTGARIGSVLIDESASQGFRVVAAKGHDRDLKKDSYVGIASPVVNIVLADKKPLLIQDIESDPRMLKTNDARYGPPSFLTLPFSVGHDTWAVLNLAHKETGELFDFDDEHILSIMVGEVSFAIENALLHSQVEDQLKKIENHNIELKEEIAERKRTEEALGESEKKYRLLVENSNDIILAMDTQGCFTYVNSVAERETGYAKSELIGKHYFILIRPDFRDKMQAHYIQQIRGGMPSTYYEFPGITKDGQEKWLGQNVQILFENGKPIGFQAIARDISKRKEAEDQIRLYAEEIEDLYNNAPCGYHSLSPDGTFLRMNDTELRWLGYSRDEIIGKRKFSDVLTPASLKNFQEFFPIFKERGWVSNLDFNLIRKDGSILPVLLNATAIKDAAGNYVMSRSTIVDMTERQDAEKMLRKSNLSLAEAQRIAHIENWEWDTQTDDMLWSDEVYRIFGLQPLELKGTKAAFLAMIHPADLALVEQTIAKGVKTDFQHRIVRRDGSVREVKEEVERIVDESGSPRLLGIIQDVTEHNAADRELQKAKDFLVQTDKLASIGRLSTGIAHEILNPLNILSIELQMFKDTEHLPSGIMEELAVCMDQIQRIVSIAENLKQFSRVPTKTAAKTDIKALVDRVLSLYSYQLKVEGIETEVQQDTDLPETLIDREKIEQVIFNLITNAITAMEGKDKKLLRIVTQAESTPRGDSIRITISDSGTGIEKEIISAIFDPFFTTKQYGKGTGLGLFISYGIIKEHGGNIWAENNQWGGASFFVELPIK